VTQRDERARLLCSLNPGESRDSKSVPLGKRALEQSSEDALVADIQARFCLGLSKTGFLSTNIHHARFSALIQVREHRITPQALSQGAERPCERPVPEHTCRGFRSVSAVQVPASKVLRPYPIWLLGQAEGDTEPDTPGSWQASQPGFFQQCKSVAPGNGPLVAAARVTLGEHAPTGKYTSGTHRRKCAPLFLIDPLCDRSD
jgi:hypothetical protein